jgi:multidrug resistance efflux pump
MARIQQTGMGIMVYTRDQIEALAKQVEAAQADVEAADATIKQAQAAIAGYAGRVVESNKEYKRQKTLDKQGATSKLAVETAGPG